MKGLILSQLPRLSGQPTNPLKLIFDNFKLMSVSKSQGIIEYTPLCLCLDQLVMVLPKIQKTPKSLDSCINLDSNCFIICQFALNSTRIDRSFPNEERSFCCSSLPKASLTLRKIGFGYY